MVGIPVFTAFIPAHVWKNIQGWNPVSGLEETTVNARRNAM